MHILVAIITVLAGGAFWWWRVKAAGDAAKEVHDVAGRAWGLYKRRKFLNRVNDAPLEVIDDPATAAVILLSVIQREDGIAGPEADSTLAREVTNTMGIADPTEILTFGKWTASHAIDANNIIHRYAPIWADKLSVSEREELVAMAKRVSNGAKKKEQKVRIERLRERIGLKI
jgi:hypothetical protein